MAGHKTIVARMRSRAGLAAAGVAAMLITLLAPPPPAAADTLYLHVWWIHCNHESEPFSDEIRLEFKWQVIGGWNDVDGDETHWYYSSVPNPLNRSFTAPQGRIHVMEEDSGVRYEIGYVILDMTQVDQGPVFAPMTQSGDDGSYDLLYEITSYSI